MNSFLLNWLPELILVIIVPAMTVIGNWMFYQHIKKKVDSQIIVYSGVLKERIEIYRGLLEKTTDLVRILNRFQYSGTQEQGYKIMEDINGLIRYYSINEPFLSSRMLQDLEKMRTEIQDIFDKMYLFQSERQDNSLAPDTGKNFWEATNKLRTQDVLGKIKNRIVQEMRADLHTSK